MSIFEKGGLPYMSTVTAPQATAVTTWNIDPVHSTAQFKVKHMMISNVKG
jgi:polyisoprenoid-binding protein YceI